MHSFRVYQWQCWRNVRILIRKLLAILVKYVILNLLILRVLISIYTCWLSRRVVISLLMNAILVLVVFYLIYLLSLHRRAEHVCYFVDWRCNLIKIEHNVSNTSNSWFKRTRLIYRLIHDHAFLAKVYMSIYLAFS